MSDLLSTKPYKGTRDFYPEDMILRRQIFDRWRKVCERYGYGEIDGPLIEPLSLYATKTSDEIVNSQLYSFEDRKGRQVAIRPEFTPTMARLIAARQQDLPLPIRFYAIPNLWRYEAPQRGRLREHWQLNVDAFGVESPTMEIEVLCLAQDLLKEFGATSKHYELKINSRRLTDALFKEVLILDEASSALVSAAIDRKAKVSEEVFSGMLDEAGLDDAKKDLLSTLLTENLDELGQRLKKDGNDHQALVEIRDLLEALDKLGYAEAVTFDITVMRGFAYYTGIIFEVFDADPENNRSMFGGGRYDNLVGAFSKKSLSGFGFGMGDVTFENFLRSHDLLPKSNNQDALAVIVMGKDSADTMRAQSLAGRLRQAGVTATVTLAGGKLGKQIQTAEKNGINKVVFFGSEEESAGSLKIKDLSTGEETETSEAEFLAALKK